MTEPDDMENLKIQLLEANKRVEEAEQQCYQAGMYGKSLMDQIKELEDRADADRQEKHELNLKLQSKQGLETMLTGEVESLREQLRNMEAREEARGEEEAEGWARKEEVWRARLSESDSALAKSEAREKALKDLLELAEKQLQESGDALNNTFAGDSFTSEFAELQQENVTLLQEKQSLEQEVVKLRGEVESVKVEGREQAAKGELMARELEELKSEVVSYVRAAEASKVECMELEAQLDALKGSQVDEDSKGNSLFSEVNDRREKVEDHMKVLTAKYELLKENYDAKISALQKTKLHNAQLLNLVGSKGDTGQVSRLESLLSAEVEKNKSLRARLDTLEDASGKSKGEAAASINIGVTSVSDEYSYLAGMLQKEQDKSKSLQEQLKKQMMQNLEDGDKLRDMTRKVNTAEDSLQRAKADIYALKAQVNELKSKNGDQKVAKKEIVKNVEILKFDKVENKPETEKTKDSFVLKEIVAPINNETNWEDKFVHRSNITETGPEPPSIINNSMKPPEISLGATPDKDEHIIPRKKCAMFAESVQVMGGDEENVPLKGDNEGGKLREKGRPKGKKQYGAKNTVRVKDDEQPECKQQ